MEILHVFRQNDPTDLVQISVDDTIAPKISASEIISCLEINDYYRSLSWL